MAVSANTVWEVRTTGADTNGGGFVSDAAGTDYSQQDAAQFSGTDLASSNGTTNPSAVTSVTHNFVAADVGNIIQITAGTNWTTGFYQIVSCAGNAATLDRAVGTAASLTNGTWAEGGALGSPGKAGSGLVGGNIIWIKSGTYSITSTTANVSNGKISISSSGTSLRPTRYEGYQSSRGDKGTQPILQLSGPAGTFDGQAIIFSSGTSFNILDNLSVDGALNGTNTTAYFFGSSNSYVIRCKASNCNVSGVGTGFSTASASNFAFIHCEASNCTTGFQESNSGRQIYCVAHGGTVGFITLNSRLIRCISYGNTSHGFSSSSTSSRFLHCTAYGNGGDGWNFSSAFQTDFLLNCLSYGNTGWGYQPTGGTKAIWLMGCAGGGNSSGNYTNLNDTGASSTVEGFVALSVSPFTNAAGGDFSLNNTAGGGALLEGTALATLAGTISGYPDIGAAQHQDTTTQTYAALTSTIGVLAQVYPSAAQLTPLYSVPSGQTATISSLIVCNTASSTINFRVSVRVAGASDSTMQYIYYNAQIGANDSYVSTIGITLGSTDQVIVYTSAVGLSFSLFGVVN